MVVWCGHDLRLEAMGLVEDCADTCRLEHKLFALFNAPLFRQAETDQAPVMIIHLGDREVAMPLRSLAREYGAVVETFSRSSTDTHVERRADLVAVAEQVSERHGRIDHVVNTAGILPRGSLLETTEETIFAATEVT